MRETKNIVIAPIHKTFFSGRNWQGLDIDLLAGHIKQNSPEVNVIIQTLDSVLSNVDKIPSNSYLFYTSSYDALYRKYIKDVIFHISQSRPDIKLVPNIDLLISFENKGYQELLKKRLNILNLKGEYFGDISDFPQEEFTNYPYVVKLPTGATSSSVHLVKNYRSLKSFLKQKYPTNYRLEAKKLLKKFLVKDKAYLTAHTYASENYDKFFSQRTPFVIQEFIEGLDCDYRVTVFGSKFYSFRRYVRENDFRASGSGNFVFEEPPFVVLDYAKEVMSKLNAPFASLDIAEKDGACYLIEFQGIGFGPSAVQKSNGYHIQVTMGSNIEWTFINEKPSLEKTYANALLEYIKSGVVEERGKDLIC